MTSDPPSQQSAGQAGETAAGHGGDGWRAPRRDGRFGPGAVHPSATDGADGALWVPVLTDRSLGMVMPVRPPYSTHGSGVARPWFYRDAAEFHHHLTTNEWAVAIVDVGHFRDRTSRPDGSRPFWRLDAVDLFQRLRGIPARPLLVLVRDRFDQSALLSVAEARGATPSLVGAISNLDDIDGAFLGLAGDNCYWVGVDPHRIGALRSFLDVLEDDGRRRTGYWMRHLLVGAAAGYLRPQAVAGLLKFRTQTVKGWIGRVDTELRKTFDLAPAGSPMSMIAATAQALQPWLWPWARRHRSHFEYGFLETVVPDAFTEVRRACGG
jgi:hypothetical protein